ncbi:MAG: sugar transferase [Lachnospiraceae bacterium]|nr:sugar transferase [Lachnospiraceae bacterium]
MTAWKAAVLTVCGLIAAGSIAAGIIDRVQQRKAERIAKTEGKAVHRPYGPYEKYFKRALDFALSSVALIVLSPLMALLALLVRVRLGSPVLFHQQRPGKDEKLFTLSKYRSLTEEKDDYGEYLPDEDRLTSFGAWVRSSSLDELPELVSIWKGDMSIVGPRPLLVKYLPLYNEEQRRRHDVRPGLTGLSQASGDVDMTWERQFALDAEYVGHVTLWMDVKIILLTVRRVLVRHRHGYGGFVRGEFQGNVEAVEHATAAK